MSEPVDKAQLYDLVVMGASAGGIEALSVLVATLPPTLPVPVVIAQHLDPNVPSHLGQILARRSKLPVRTVGEAEPNPERLSPGTIYVVPSDRDVEIADSIVRLRSGVRQHPMPSIDRLFTSAAEVYGERVIAVILTGSGSDGTIGARAVKSAGGTVLIENPQTASYPTMPASLPPTSVDLVVNLDHMGTLIADLISGAQSLIGPPSGDTLSAVLEQVRQHTNIDFSQYKRPTILRRLHRRMAAMDAATLQDYQQILETHPEEYHYLVASFLINVTEFFRDPALFEFLRESVLPDVITYARMHGPAHEIRVWSAGCSTGEEPYSIAMLLAEALGSDALQFTVRIFATDVDTDAVVFARRGRYPAAALANVPEHLRARYFTPVDNSFEISKAIRSMVIFGEHDLGQRAPFPHMDLVICRNVLIYFTSDLQTRALQLFAFSLRDGGYLTLGNAESAGTLSQYFGQVHTRFKIYRRQGEHVLVPPVPVGGRFQYESDMPTERIGSPQARLRLIPSPTSNEGQSPVSELAVNEIASTLPEAGIRIYTARERFADQILGLPMGVVVVDRNYDVLTINSAAYALFDMHRPAVGKDLLHLAERVPTKPLRAAIDQTFDVLEAPEATASPASTAAQSKMSIQVELEQGEPGERHLLQITCYPHLGTMYTVDGGTKPTVDAVVLFIAEIPPTTSPPGAAGDVASSPGGVVAESEALPPGAPAKFARDEMVQRLTQQLEVERARVRELRTATQELRDDNENLRRANEDLVVAQEEVQASSEETKTLNEEMQATNEELETLNEELEATVEELRTTNDDLAARALEQRAFADQKDAERQVIEQERAQLESIVSSIGDAVMAVDADGEQIFANDAYQQLFGGIDATAELGDEHGEPLAPAAWPWRRIVHAAPFRMVFSLRMPPDDRPRWFEAVGQPVSSDERRIGGVLTIRDLADQVLRNLYRRFYMQAGQELTIPVAMLTTALQQLVEHLPALGDGDHKHEQLQGELATTLRQAHHLGLVVGDLRDPERTREDRMQLAREPVDLVELIQQVVRDLALALPTGQSGSSAPPIVVRTELEPERSITVIGDGMRLEQVVRNLLINALTEAPESERVDVHIRRVPGQATPEIAEFEVEDYGPEFPKGYRELVFTPPFEGSLSSLAIQGALGLGLYIAQQVVQAHGGTMTMRSPEGRGAVFTVRLPLDSKGQGASEPTTRRQTKRTDRSHPSR